MKYAFAGDRQISCNILQFLIDEGFRPSALFVSDSENTTHSEQLIEISGLEENFIFHGNDFKTPDTISALLNLDLDYIFGIHFPYIVPQKVLEIPNVGFLNLHPAYLPFNKGWHTPTWAILEGTPYGATLHFMGIALDEGDIIHQKMLEVLPEDTANSLYQRVLSLEEEVFYEAFDSLKHLNPPRIAQAGDGSAHSKRDLRKLQEITLEKNLMTVDLLTHLKALTTNNPKEAAFFLDNSGRRIGVQIKLFDMDAHDPS